MQPLTKLPARLGLSLLLALLVLAGCHRSRSAAQIILATPSFVGAVTIAANTNPWVPLAAAISLATDVPTRVELRITDPQRSWDVIAVAGYATDHDRVPVVGMQAGRLHSIEVTVRDALGNATAAPTTLEFTTPALPSYFPPIEVVSSLPQYMEDGVTLLAIMSGQSGSMPTIIDAAGDVIWFLDVSLSPIGSQDQVMTIPQRNGNLMLIVGNSLLVEVNMLGDILQMFFASGLGGAVPGAISIDTDSFHHDFVELPEGADADYAVLGSELRTLPNYPSDVVNPSQTVPTADVIGDEIVEFNRDGTVVRRLRLFDILDPYRVGYDSLSDFWDDHYGQATFDWSHANGLALDPATDSWIVSLRHQDMVFKLQRTTGQLEWILGDHGRWNAPWSDQLLTPIGTGFAWQYHQHAPQLQPDGSLMLFDNGNQRAIPPAAPVPFPEAYSRAVQFRVDENVGSVEQLWAYGGPPNSSGPSFYSFFVSSAYRMPKSGNVLVCDGGKAGPGGRLFGRVFEITTEPTPQVVFEFKVQADGVANTTSYFLYRAYRLPGVYR